MTGLHRADGSQQQNPDGSWSQAIPLPLYVGIWRKRFQCECGQKFRTEQAYRDHWMTFNLASKHRDSWSVFS